MFWTINKSFLVTCIIILDVLLLINIQNKKNSTVLIIEKPKTVTVASNNSAQIGTAKITVPKPKITALAEVTVTFTPTSAPSTPTNNLEIKQTVSGVDNLLSQVNAYRATKGLPPVSSEAYTCAFANTRAGEITSAFNHDGFSSRVNSKNLPYPSYSEIAENIAMSSNPADVVQAWIDSPGHNENMLKNTPHACIGNSGNYYAYESWRP